MSKCKVCREGLEHASRAPYMAVRGDSGNAGRGHGMKDLVDFCLVRDGRSKRRGMKSLPW